MEEIEKTRDTQLLIAMADNIQIAFEVDQVIGIETIEEENRREIPVVIRGESTGYIGGILNIRDQIVVEISVANIMSESEWADIEQLMREHE